MTTIHDDTNDAFSNWRMLMLGKNQEKHFLVSPMYPYATNVYKSMSVATIPIATASD